MICIRISASKSSRPGFVLILVLMLITVTTLYAAGLARRSLLLALESAAAEEQLQQTWAERSLLAAAHQQADELFRSPERGDVTVESTNRIGDESYLLIISDESAKLNLNALIDDDISDIHDSLQDMKLNITLTAVNKSHRPLVAKSVNSWGEFFDLKRTTAIQLARQTRDITLWSDGRLNINRADLKLVHSLIEHITNRRTANKAQEILGQGPVQEIPEFLSQLALSDQDRDRLGRLLTNTSRSTSLYLLPTHGPARIQILTRHSTGRVEQTSFQF